MTPIRPLRRGSGLRGARPILAAALLAAVAAVPSAASAEPGRVSAEPGQAPARSGSPGPAYERVAHFYGAYIDVANDPGSNKAAAALRTFYLTPDLRERLLGWERRHDADGVLRAQNVPTAWRVTAGDSGMGKTTSTVRLTWGTGQKPTYTYLTVQSDLATRRITDIKSAY
ncbi:hypothetical protein [Streptomyces sp. AN091965]|uniref:hypothetical protein n=1 Tax=Streptomyces sp. AN091965 TaxID=2927803 RepID=UPI001F606BCC|nr:hypothetical protein [Streptomyces sp. AN091965]MCI3930814.1 hypothetical protein [Streptomyces sp. AN091965]